MVRVFSFWPLRFKIFYFYISCNQNENFEKKMNKLKRTSNFKVKKCTLNPYNLIENFGHSAYTF